MIHFLVTRDHAYTVELYLQTWGRDLRDRVHTLYYEDLPFGPRLNPGAYIFSDLERLSRPQTELAICLHNQLAARPAAFKLLNDPAKVVRRFDLLRTLQARGLNSFSVKRIDDAETMLKFPIFLRNESDHKGAISPLLNDQSEVDRAIADAVTQGQSRSQLMLAEYVDIKNAAGLYHKYSYFRMGGRLIPRHLVYSRKWVVKYIDLVDADSVEEEMSFLQSSPHAEQVQKVFEIAKVDYGRIDYAVVYGQMYTWEINTNPVITVAPGRVAIPRLHATGIFAAQFVEAIKSIDHTPPNESPHRFEIPRDLARQLDTSLARRTLRPFARAFRWLANHPSVDRISK